MPYGTRKVKGGRVKVVNKATGRVHAKATTPAKAEAQMNLLRGVEHGWEPTGAPAKRREGMSPRELIHHGLKTGKASRKRRK
jgi:hypothetical protein